VLPRAAVDDLEIADEGAREDVLHLDVLVADLDDLLEASEG
jgi:hypothetical protein